MTQKPNVLSKDFVNKILEERTVKEGDCLIWQGTRDIEGYAKVCLKPKVVRVARLIAWAFHGLDLRNKKLFACHKCDVPSCCNPNHIFIGTHLINMKDAQKKQRALTRDTIGGSKIKSSDIDIVIQRYKSGESYNQIAKTFNCRKQQIYKIIKKTGIKTRPTLALRVLCIETGQIFTSAGEAGRALGIDRTNITRACKGKWKKVKGLTFKFI